MRDPKQTDAGRDIGASSVPATAIGEMLHRLTQYLERGGLFNPELMAPDQVRDLLIDCRALLLHASTQDVTKPSAPNGGDSGTPTAYYSERKQQYVPMPTRDTGVPSVPKFDYVKKLAEAQAIVRQSVLWKRFIDGTPLSNDIAVWMVEFARPKLSIDENGDTVCEHGTAMDVHCCNCHSGFIFDKDHECPPEPSGDTEVPSVNRLSDIHEWFYKRGQELLAELDGVVDWARVRDWLTRVREEMRAQAVRPGAPPAPPRSEPAGVPQPQRMCLCEHPESYHKDLGAGYFGCKNTWCECRAFKLSGCPSGSGQPT